MGKARRMQKAIERREREYALLAARRAGMTPPAPGSLKEGDICPCGCGGVMTDVGGVLTALTFDMVGPDGRVVRVG